MCDRKYSFMTGIFYARLDGQMHAKGYDGNNFT